MAECDNGHGQAGDQDSCDPCDVSASKGEQTPNKFHEGVSEAEAEADLAQAGQPGPFSVAGAVGRLWTPERRPSTLVVGFLFLLAVVAVLGIAAPGGSDAPEDQARPEQRSEGSAQEAEVEAVSPQDACFQDLNSILVASSQGVTADEAILAIAEVYGYDDRRSQFMVSNYTRYLNEVNSLGATTANGAAVERVVTWCDDNARDFDY